MHEIKKDTSTEIPAITLGSVSLSHIENPSPNSEIARLGLPFTEFGAPVTEDVMHDFDNPEIEGLVYRVDKGKPIEIDESYQGWYTKACWGQKGAGLYVHHSEDATDAYFQAQVNEPRHGNATWHKSALRVSNGIYFDQRDDAQNNAPLEATEAIVDTYLKTVDDWLELSKLDPNEKQRQVHGIKTPDIRGHNRGHLIAIQQYLNGLKEQPTDTRPSLTMQSLAHITDAIPDSETYKTFSNMLLDGELFGLFLKKLGYDGILYSFNNGHTASVTWNMAKIGTKETWAKRL